MFMRHLTAIQVCTFATKHIHLCIFEDTFKLCITLFLGVHHSAWERCCAAILTVTLRIITVWSAPFCEVEEWMELCLQFPVWVSWRYWLSPLYWTVWFFGRWTWLREYTLVTLRRCCVLESVRWGPRDCSICTCLAAPRCLLCLIITLSCWTRPTTVWPCKYRCSVTVTALRYFGLVCLMQCFNIILIWS